MNQSLIPAVDSNPFSTRYVRPGAIPFRFTQPNRTAQLGQLAEAIRRHTLSLIVGPHGTGKSTLLRSLRPLLSSNQLLSNHHDVQAVLLSAPEAGGIRERLRQRHDNARLTLHRQRILDDGGLLIVDGLEQLTYASRRRLLRRSRLRHQRILATSHQPIWPFQTIFQTATDPHIVQAIVDDLLQAAPHACVQRVQQELACTELTTATNVRELLFALFDVVADVQPIEPPTTFACCPQPESDRPVASYR